MLDQEAVKIIFIGEVNTGKSSIIKYLTKDQGIHTYPIPGETVAVTSYPYKDFELVDTPGLNDTNTDNVKKTVNALKETMQVVLVLNAAGTVLSKSELSRFKKLRRNKKHVLIVVNKRDKADSIESIERFIRKETEASSPIIIVSTKTGEGMKELEEALINLSKIEEKA